MKHIFSPVTLALFILAPLFCKSQFNVAVSANTICFQQVNTSTVSVTNTPSTATAFSWSAVSPSCSATFSNLAVNGATSEISYPCCGVFTITCTAYNGTAVVGTTTDIANVICPPTLSISSTAPSGTICTGNNVTLTASGAANYTWVPGNLNNASVQYSIGINTCYSVTGENGGCTNLSIYCLSVTPNSTVSITGTSVICLGETVTLTAHGSTNYSWVPLGSTNTVIVHTPSTSYMYVLYDVSGHQCPGSVGFPVIVNPNPTVNISQSTPSVICGNSATISISGAHTYTWSNAQNGSSIVVNPLVNTCYTATGSYSYTSGCKSSATVCIQVTQQSLSVNGANTVCAGNTINLTASAAGNYTWIPGNNTGTLVNITPSATTNYSVSGSMSNGCAVSNTHAVSVLFPTAISVSGNTAYCTGQSGTLSASGAIAYSWSPGGASAQPLNITPTVSTTYSVQQLGVSCPLSATINVTVNPLPTLTINPLPGQSIQCSTTTTIQALGNAQSFTWSTGQNAQAIQMMPLANTCFTVVCESAAGCTNSASSCLTVTPQQLQITGSSTVCAGSSSDLTVTPAGSYTWQPGALSGTVVNILPLTNTVYSLTGNTTIGCLGTATFALNTNTSCAIVWPGDANNDGAVNSTDIFELGLRFNNTGAARTTSSNSWTGEFSTTWSGTVSTGKNNCHADCNGDGVVNHDDTIAVYLNYLNTHSFKIAHSTNPDLKLVPVSPQAVPGWNKVNVVLGDSTLPINQVYGIAFEITFESQFFENNGMYLSYPSSVFNSGNSNVEFRKKDISAEKIYAATVRTDGKNISGEGIIAEFWFMLRSDLLQDATFSIGLSAAQIINNKGTNTQLTAGVTNLSVNNDFTGLTKSNDELRIDVYPQPASGELNIRVSVANRGRCTLFDLFGTAVKTQMLSVATTMDVSSIKAGTYILCIEVAGKKQYRKVILQN